MWISAIYVEKTKQVWNQNLDDVWLCHEIYDEGERVFGQKNDEIVHGLTSDVFCTLVQSSSGQDRGGRNLTNDHFFTLVDLVNQPKKIDTCWDNETEQKRNSTRVQACQATWWYLVCSWIYQRSHTCAICPKVEQISILLSSLHHDSAICSNSGKPEII
jgi:hypothetical protein